MVRRECQAAFVPLAARCKRGRVEVRSPRAMGYSQRTIPRLRVWPGPVVHGFLEMSHESSVVKVIWTGSDHDP